MPRHGKENNPSVSQQITFFTDEEAADTYGTNQTDTESKKNLSENGVASVKARTDVTGITETDMQDTEIIDFEVLPEQSVEPISLPSSDDEFKDEQDTFDEAEIPLPRKKPKKERPPRGSLRNESVLIYFLTVVASVVTRIIKNSFFASLLTAYDKTAELFRASFLYRFFSEKPAVFFKSFKKHVRRIYTDSRVPKKLNFLAMSLLRIKSRIYGLIFCFFGVSAIFVHFFVSAYFSITVFNVYTPVIAVCVIAASMFFIFSGKTLSGVLLSSKIFSAFAFTLLGLNKNSLDEEDGLELSGSGAVVLGLLLGFLTVVFPIQSILLFLLSVIYISVVLKSPETGLISLFLIAPFASLKALVIATSAISVSYIFKVICGKRTLSLEFPDLFVGMFAFMILFGKLITFGNKGNALMWILFICMYFIAASILRSSIWFKKSINAIILIGSAVSIYALIARFLGNTLELSLDYTLETDVGNASASILGSLSVLSYFVLMLGIFLFASLLICKTKAMRFGLIIANIATGIYLFSTLPSGAWLAAVTAYIAILLLWRSKTAIYMIIAGFLLPFLPAINVYSAEHFFENLINTTERYDLWNAVIRMLFGFFGVGGIGMGENAFSHVYSAYFIGNTENAVHAGSLLMQITVSLGIFGLIIFIAIIFFTLQSSFSYGRSCSDKFGFNRIICYAGACGIIASVLWGINEFIWYNPRLMLLFWLIMGVTVSARRSALVLEADNKEANLFEDTYSEQ